MSVKFSQHHMVNVVKPIIWVPVPPTELQWLVQLLLLQPQLQPAEHLSGLDCWQH
jgi:hypothetical protein